MANHFLNTLTARGYTEVFAPTLINSQSLRGTGQLPKFEEDLFKIGGEWDLYLSPTAEVPLTNLVSQSVLSKEQLPIRMCCYSSCYRSESGQLRQGHTRYIRQHQFQKVEMVHVCEPETSYEELELLTANAEYMLQSLGLAYRMIVLCSGTWLRSLQDLRLGGLDPLPEDLSGNLQLFQLRGHSRHGG